MSEKPFYITAEQWRAAGPTPGMDNHRGTVSRILRSLPDDETRQTALLTELVTEVHTVKLILAWTLVVVPLIVLVLGIVALVMMNAAPVASTDDVSGF